MKQESAQTDENKQSGLPGDKSGLSTEQWRDLLNHSVDLVFRFNLIEGRYDYVSQSVEKHTGYTREEVLAGGMNLFMQNLHPDDKDTFAKLLANIKNTSGGDKIHLEYRYRHKSGLYLWKSCNGRILRNSKGDVIAMLGITRDITSEKLFEAGAQSPAFSLKPTESKTPTVGIFIHDNRQFVQANQQFAHMFGYTLEELDNINRLDLIEPDFHEAVEGFIKSGHQGPYEILCRRKDGSTFPAEVRADEIRIDGEVLRIAAVRDLTRQKKMEQALQQNEQKNEDLYRNNLTSLFRIRVTDGKILRGNHALANVLEHDLSEQNFTRYLKNPEDYVHLLLALEQNQTVEGFQVALSLDGKEGKQEKWVSITAALHADQGFIEGSLQDITGYKALSPAEKKVLRHLLAGKSNKETAFSLRRSVRTVEEHRASIMRKLNVDNIVHLTRKAMEYGITPDGEE